MRFVVTGEWKKNSLLRMILFFFLIYIFFFWMTNWVLFFEKMDLNPSSIVQYYLGDPDAEFGQPARPLAALAEQSHFHLFAMGMLVMTLTHLLLFIPTSIKVKGGVVLITFLSSLMDEASSWLIRFVDPVFAWLKLVSFLTLQLALLGLLVLLLIGVIRPMRNAYEDSTIKRTSPYGGSS